MLVFLTVPFTAAFMLRTAVLLDTNHPLIEATRCGIDSATANASANMQFTVILPFLYFIGNSLTFLYFGLIPEIL